MPYYKEYYLNRGTTASIIEDGVRYQETPVVLDSTEITTFRTHPPQGAMQSRELLDIEADPYAYFLDSTSKRNYQARLKERGLPAQGRPDRGHAFELKKHTIRGQLASPTVSLLAGTRPYTDTYENAFVLPEIPSGQTRLDHIHSGTLFSPAPYAEAGLEGFAQRAYNRTAPTGVVFSAGALLEDLFQGIPKLTNGLVGNAFESASDWFRAAGNVHLGGAFGWFPFLSDIKSAGDALAKATHALTQQGQRVHRRYSLPASTKSDTVSFDSQIVINGGFSRGFIPLTGNSLGETGFINAVAPFRGAVDHTKSMNTRRWFEGEFSFFYPLQFNPDDYLSRLDVLVNQEITPADLWEMAPWSWMTDWFLGIQDTIRANELAGNDHLIMHYGYAMEETTYKVDLSWRKSSGTLSNWTNVPYGGRLRSTTAYKRRIRANPYGFQLSPNGTLTGNQLAILGSLGLTKLK